MKDYRKVRRIFEQAATQGPLMKSTTPPPTAMPELPTFNDFKEEPSALPKEAEAHQPVDPQTMTVRDFIAKVQSINPLVAMGLTDFIDKNQAAFGNDIAQEPAAQDDLQFSSQVPPAEGAPQEPVEADLDFPA